MRRTLTLPTQLLIGYPNDLAIPLKPVNAKNALQFLFKPSGATWTSSYIKEGAVASDWVRWCFNEQPDWLEGKIGVLFEASPDAYIYEIDGKESYFDLLKKYPLVTVEKLNQAYRDIYRDQPMTDKLASFWFDWEAIAKDYDAVHLTQKAFWQLRMEPLCMTIYAADCECTWWLRKAWTRERFCPDPIIREQYLTPEEKEDLVKRALDRQSRLIEYKKSLEDKSNGQVQ